MRKIATFSLLAIAFLGLFLMVTLSNAQDTELKFIIKTVYPTYATAYCRKGIITLIIFLGD